MYQKDPFLKKQLEAKYGNEQVFAVPLNETLHIDDRFTENYKEILCDADLLTLRQWDAKGKFILRSDAEYDPTLQQLIPYVLIQDVTGTKFYVSRRIAGEERLKNTLSLGFGGHINPIDGTRDIIMKSFERELNEEVFIKRKKVPTRFLGYVRDLSSPTKDHLGFAFAVTARYVKIKEYNVLEGSWMTLQDLVDNYYKFEGWARYVIDYLFEAQQKKLA